MNNTPYFVAEIGPNHNGSLKLAFELLEAAASAGANCVKFQLGNPDLVYSLDSFKASYQVDNERPETIKEMSSRFQLAKEDHFALYDKCLELNVSYSCTAFDIESLQFLNENFELPFLKIPSGEILTTDLLDYVSKANKPMVLSTGMSTLDEISFAVDRLTSSGNNSLTILHCVSQYPAEVSNLNLSFIRTLQNNFGFPVGFSDHSLGYKAIELAYAMGCLFFEKHFTLDNSLPGPDHRASSLPDELSYMIQLLKSDSVYLGSSDKSISTAELEIRSVARKSLVASTDLPAGHVLSLTDLCFKRPGTGIPPNLLHTVVGRRLNQDIPFNRLIHYSHLID